MCRLIEPRRNECQGPYSHEAIANLINRCRCGEVRGLTAGGLDHECIISKLAAATKIHVAVRIRFARCSSGGKNVSPQARVAMGTPIDRKNFAGLSDTLTPLPRRAPPSANLTNSYLVLKSPNRQNGCV